MRKQLNIDDVDNYIFLVDKLSMITIFMPFLPKQKYKSLPQLLIDESTVSNKEQGILIKQNSILILITISVLLISIFMSILMKPKKSSPNF